MNAKQNLNQDSMKKKITLKVNNSKMINNFKNDYETLETKTQSKTDKIIDTQKKASENNIPSKSNLENLKNLKCLSTEKLLKIENHNFNNSNNHDEILSNSYEEKNENEKKKEEEEKKKKELLITNNIKRVFVDSKISGKEQNEDEDKEKENTLTRDSTNSVSSSSFGYELNFYRNGNDIRQSYISKLISIQVWNPNMKPKQHNSIIIFY